MRSTDRPRDRPELGATSAVLDPAQRRLLRLFPVETFVASSTPPLQADDYPRQPPRVSLGRRANDASRCAHVRPQVQNLLATESPATIHPRPRVVRNALSLKVTADTLLTHQSSAQVRNLR